MQNENKVLLSGRFMPSGKQTPEERIEDLERYLVLLTEELEMKMSQS